MSTGGNAIASALVGHITSQVERDADVVAALSGTTEDLARKRAAATLGTDNRDAAVMVATSIRRKVTQTGKVTPEDAETLVAAEVIEGRRTAIGLEVEALIREG